MTKHEFLSSLGEALRGVAQEEAEKSLSYYSEIIDDLMEEGMSEEEAVASLGSPQEIAARFKDELGLVPAVRARMKGGSGKGLIIALLVLGSPVWLAIGIAVFAVLLSVYICIWAVDIALWAAVAGFAGGAVGGLIASAGMMLAGFWGHGGMVLSGSLVSAGCAVLLFLGVLWISKQIVVFSVWLFKRVKRALFGKKEAV